MGIHISLSWLTSSCCVLQQLEKRLCEIRIVTPMAHLNAGHHRLYRRQQRRCHNYSCGTTAMEKLTWSHAKIWIVPHDDHLHPYHYSRTTHLFPDSCLLWRMDTSALSYNILRMDEACFMHEGMFNTHNSHLWAQDDPHAVHEYGYQVHFSVSCHGPPTCYLKICF